MQRIADLSAEGDRAWDLYMEEEDADEELLAEQNRQYRIRRDLLNEQGIENEREIERILQQQTDRLKNADRWMLSTCMSKDNAFEDNSTAFNLLKRPEIERLFAYYLIEKGCPKSVSDSDMILFRRKNYMPDMEKLQKTSVSAAELGRVYQQICNAGVAIESMDAIQGAMQELKNEIEEHEERQQALRRAKLHRELQARLAGDAQQEEQEEQEELQKQEELQEQQEQEEQNEQVQTNQHDVVLLDEVTQVGVEEPAEEEQEQEQAKSILVMVNDVTAALDELEKLKEEYDHAGWFQKLRKKSKVKAAVEKLYSKTNELLAAKVHIPGNESASSVMDYVKDAMVAGNAAKALGSGVASRFKTMAMGGALEWASAAKMTSMGVNIFGAVLGSVNLLLAVFGILKSMPGFTKLTKVGQAGLVMDWVNQLATPSSATASSVTGALFVGGLATQTAVTATAGVGILAGGVSAAVGTYKMGSAIRGGRLEKKAYEKLQHANGVLPEEEQEKKRIYYVNQNMADIFWQPQNPFAEQNNADFLFEKNILKIQERINKRAKISAGCLMASGVCAMAASGLLVGQQHMLAAVAGLTGLAFAAGGMITTQVMKRGEYEKVVDEFLDLDEMLRKRVEEIRQKSGKEPGWFEKRKLKKKLRQEMMEMFGFSSVKAFYVDLMKQYALYIYKKIQPESDDFYEYGAQRPNVNENTAEKREAFLLLVESLGLKYKERVDDGNKEILPTPQLIFQKLMG